MASNFLKEFRVVKEGNPTKYAVQYTSETHSKGEFKLRRCEVGNASTAEEKVIVLVGETGAGKTTLINSFLNYLYQVSWEDNYRLVLSYDEHEEKMQQEDEDEMASLTEWVSVYVFNDTPDHMPYKVTIVDTPGYGCTKGEAHDRYITSQIQELFSGNESWTISSINAVVFVLKDSVTRLTDIHTRIYQSVLSLFGNDISNIYAFATFGDIVGQSKAYNALKRGDVPVKKCYVLNNGVLYEDKASLDKGGREIRKSIWNNRSAKFKEFFKEVGNKAPNELTKTVSVLQKRETLEIIITGIPDLLKSYLILLQEFKVEETALFELESDITKHEDYKYKVNVQNLVTLKNPEGLRARVCEQCKTTCHYPCDHPTKFLCSAMRWLSFVRGCGVCAENCGISHHVKRDYRYKRVMRVKYVTKNDVKVKYNVALENKEEKEKAVKEIQQRKHSIQKKIDEQIKHAKICIKEIKDLALRPTSYTIVTYLNELIKQEASERDAGWRDRVEQLEKLCKREEE